MKFHLLEKIGISILLPVIILVIIARVNTSWAYVVAPLMLPATVVILIGRMRRTSRNNDEKKA